MLGSGGKVALLRIESQPPGLESILLALEKWHPVMAESVSSCKMMSSRPKTPLLHRKKNIHIEPMTSVPYFVQKYVEGRWAEEKEVQVYGRGHSEDWEYDEEEVDEKVEKIRKGILEEIVRNNGRNYVFEGGCSIYNFVGGMLKRNHNLIHRSILESMGAAKRIPRAYEKEEGSR